jgi:hypothetical protein
MTRIQAERVAYEALTKLMQDAVRCRELFDAAGLELSEPLRRLFGEPKPAPQVAALAKETP